MEDSLNGPRSKGSIRSQSITNKTTSQVVTSRNKTFPWQTLRHSIPLRQIGVGKQAPGQILSFIVKLAALELVRRISRTRCPLIWRSLQSLQILCYPPFKWIQKWAPLRILVKGMQKLSGPLFLLSMATTFPDLSSDLSKRATADRNDCQPSPEASDVPSINNMRISTESSEEVAGDNWMLKLIKELERQGIIMPERITEDDLHRFYLAADGDLACFISSVKKTIRWRETYTILSVQELDTWSHLVFWHGCDAQLRPCLIVRLGLACSSLPYHDRPRFAQAVVSQIEHGVLHLVNIEDPRITVLLDCEGVSAIRFPMQMMRSFSALVQDHYPNRLCLLFVLRLPPVVRVIAQTLFQVLKPTTRQKLRVVGERYPKVLAEHLTVIPTFLGGSCTCPMCGVVTVAAPRAQTEERTRNGPAINLSDVNEVDLDSIPLIADCDRVLRTVIVGLLMFWILIALIAGMYEPDTFSHLAS